MNKYAIILLSVFAVAVSGCKSVLTQQQTQYNDSVILSYHYDTLHTIITDTLYIQATDEQNDTTQTEIVFADGGTYNAQTGAAQNVLSVKISVQLRRLQSLVANKQTTIEQQAHTTDSLNTEIKKLQQELLAKQNTKDIKPTLSAWQRFIMGCGYALLGIIIISLIILVVHITIKIRCL